MATFGDFPDNTAQTQQTQPPPQEDNWERKVLQDLALAALKEQRSKRRWGYVFKGLVLLYLVAVLILMNPFGKSTVVTDEHTALVEVSGLISSETAANADNIITGIRQAFESPSAKGLIIRLNTPGGSPVQAGLINDEIRRLRETRPDFPVYAVIQDVSASGGYYIAVAAEEIYADKASIVGSIGVRMDSFGFSEAIDKLGVERRSITAGKNKAFLDPFKPLKQDDVDHAENMLGIIHQQFIDVVKQGRGDRLADDPDLFSGLFWSGEQSLELGLIDGLAGSGEVARELIGAEEIIDYTPRPSYLDRLSQQLGTSLGELLIMEQWRLK